MCIRGPCSKLVRARVRRVHESRNARRTSGSNPTCRRQRSPPRGCRVAGDRGVARGRLSIQLLARNSEHIRSSRRSDCSFTGRCSLRRIRRDTPDRTAEARPTRHGKNSRTATGRITIGSRHTETGRSLAERPNGCSIAIRGRSCCRHRTSCQQANATRRPRPSTASNGTDAADDATRRRDIIGLRRKHY